MNNMFDRKEYVKHWRERNPNYMKQYMKKWYRDNSNYIKNYRKKWYRDNPNYMKNYMKKRYRDNTEIINTRNKKWKKNNPEKMKKYRIKWNEKNIGYYNEYLKQYFKQKYKQDLKFNLNRKISTRIVESLKRNKTGRQWETIVGYTLEDLIKRLKKTMPKGYNWQDFIQGKLHIDHIIPISAFNFDCPEHIDFKNCWALENLRLLPAKENLIKGNKLARPFQPALKI